MHLRAEEVIQKTNQDLEKLKERVNEERHRKEMEEQKQIEQNRVDKNTKGKKVKVDEWDELYAKRFKNYIDVRNKKLEDLNDKWNKPIQGIPVINRQRNEFRINKNIDQNNFGDRLYNYAEFKVDKIKKLERDLTPNFTPHINKNTDKLIK